MGTTYMDFSTGVFHVDGGDPLTQAQVDSVWRHLPTTGASWVERGNLFVQQFDGAKAFNLGPVERGVKGASDKVRFGGDAKRHHATKKSPAQLQREIDEALAGTETKPISESSYLGGLRYKTETYGPGGNRSIPETPSSKKTRKSKAQRDREAAEALEKSQRWLVMFQMPGSQWAYVATTGSGSTMDPNAAHDFGSRAAAEVQATAMQGPRSSLRAKVTSRRKA